MGNTMDPGAAQEAIALSLSQHFEIERFNRAIEATADAEALRRLAKQLLQAWQTQQAATNWVIRQQMGPGLPSGPVA
ncbi:MAG: hypothetical protein RLZZ219_1225 [Cyanobacteriota bacterium]|jgi:hypothetical protein